jgi:hypothetical protein
MESAVIKRISSALALGTLTDHAIGFERRLIAPPVRT